MTKNNRHSYEFKAWDTVNKKMLDMNDFILKGVEDHGWLPFDHEGQMMVTKKDSDSLIILQCTGRADRIGQKVFEGHLLKSDNGNVYEVVYDSKYVGFRLKNSEGHKGDSLQWPLDIRLVIVGNIYEGDFFLEDSA